MKKIAFALLIFLSPLFCENYPKVLQEFLIQTYKKEYPKIKIENIDLKTNQKKSFSKEDIQNINIPKSYIHRNKGYLRVYLKNKKRVSFSYKIKASMPVFETITDIKKNQKILPSFLKEKSIKFKYLSQKPLTKKDLNEIKAARFIKKGTVLTRNMIKRETVLEKGDKIVATLKEDGMTFEFPVILLQDADISDIAKVKTLKGKRLKAKIISKTKAIIE
ncbi:MAG: flagellar basal body P-ring formation protein FlgA [Epsilonproteobacteria bacterium]|nr:flagellar basal body P-ring formation protein FlgA [Campylobacterota bacterium]